MYAWGFVIVLQKMTSRCEINFSRPDDKTLLITLSGNCTIAGGVPSFSDVQQHFESAPPLHRLTFNAENLSGWDSSLLTFLITVFNKCKADNIRVETDALPAGICKLITLASAVPERKAAPVNNKYISLSERVGENAIDFGHSVKDTLGFIGEVFVSFLKMTLGRARFKPSELFLIIQETGAQALPIVSLISLLVGLILAFIGAIQLKLFGAQIYVADLVGIGMVREMGAIMTGIIMAGRTGAAFAARIGTMQVNEEIDALTTLGISPIEFLVLPRVLALFLMMPLLTLYADLMGVLGGMIVGIGLLDLNFMEYYNETLSILTLTDLWIGVFMGAVFGILISMSGCLRGMQCGRSASAVGEATTSAVVTGIVSIVVATAIINIICHVLGI
jgi:phospholipid/cholesterol/gamma-HCH transport system permease protein